MSQSPDPFGTPNAESTPSNAPAPASAPTLADAAGKKVAAGVLGILLGALGIHKFVLGYKRAGVIMLVITLAGWCGFAGLAWVFVGLPCIGAPALMSIFGLIEGIIYLTKTDQQFLETYLVGKREWF